MATTPYDPYRDQIAQLRKENPSVFQTDDDAYNWGTRYYGWGAESQTPPATGAPASGGGGTASPLPPSAPPPSTPPPPESPLNAGGPGPVLPPGFDVSRGGGTPHQATGRTVTVNGQTFVIPEPPALNTTPGVGAAPQATAATLDYSPEDPMMGVVREQLLNLMARANTTPTLNDPTLKPASDAYAAAQERARRESMADTAESLSARGIGSSGAAEAAQRRSYETMGQNVGAFQAGLLTDEQAARRQDLQSALGMANQLGMFKEQNKLQRDLATLDTQTKTNLANLDAQLKTAGLTLQERLGIMDAELKKYGIDLQGDLGLLNTVLENEFNYAQLKVQTDIANLDANVKMQLGQLDAQLRQQGMSLQERLAILDNEVRKYGIDTQGNLGNLEVALRKELGIGQLKLGLLQALLGNQQFYDQLGWDMGSWAAEQNANIGDWL